MSFDKKRNKWIAQITFQRKNHCLGRFDDKEDAINARLEGEERFFGKYRKDGKQWLNSLMLGIQCILLVHLFLLERLR